MPRWEVSVLEATGVAPSHWFLAGWRSLLVAMRNFVGELPLRSVDTLWPCEQCPSCDAPRVRVAQRRYVGDRNGEGAGAADPLLVMVPHMVN